MFSDDDKEFEAFMNQGEEDNTSKSLGSFNFRVGGNDRARSIGSRSTHSTFNRNPAKSIGIDSNLIEKYDIGSKTLPLKAKRKKKRKGRKKGRRRKNKSKGSIPDSLYDDQPLRENKPKGFDSPSDEDEKTFNSIKSRYGEEFVIRKKGSEDFSDDVRSFEKTPRDKIGKEADLSMRLSSTMDNDGFLDTGKNPIGLSTLDEQITLDVDMKDSIDNEEVDEDDMDISFVDMTRDSVGLDLGGRKNRRKLFGDSDDNFGGKISTNLGFSSNNSITSITSTTSPSSSGKVFRHGTLMDVEKDDLSSATINKESVYDSSVDYLDPHDSEEVIPTKTKKSPQRSTKNRDSDSEIEKLKNDVSKIEKEKETQNTKISDLEEEIEKLKKENLTLKEEKQDVLEQHEETLTLLGTIQVDLKEKEESMESLQTSISNLQFEKQEVDDLLEDERIRVQEMKKQIEELKSQEKEEEVSVVDIIASSEDKKANNKVVKELEEEREMRMELQESNKIKMEQVDRLEGKQILLENLLKERDGRISSLEKENELLHSDIEEAKKMEKKKRDEEKNRNEDGDENSEVKNLEKMLKATQDDNERILERLKVYERMEKENETKDSAEIKELKQTNSELKEKVEMLQAEKQKYSQHSVIIARLRQEKDTITMAFEDEKLTWKEERKNYIEKIEWWKKNQELISEKENEVHVLKSEINQMKEEIEGGGGERGEGGGGGFHKTTIMNTKVMDDLIKENKRLKKRLEDPTRLSQIIKRTVKERDEESNLEVENLKNDLLHVKDTAAKSMRALRQEFEKTKAQYESRIKELKKQKKNSTSVNSGRGFTRKRYLLEKKKFEEQIAERDGRIKEITEQNQSYKSQLKVSSRKVSQVERKLNRMRENQNISKRKEEDVQKTTKRFEEKILRMESEKERMIQKMRMDHEKEMVEKENELRSLPFDEKSRRVMMKVEEQMNRLARFESNQRVMRMRHSQEIEELKANHEIEHNRTRIEFNRILQNKNVQVKKFKLMLDQVMEDISRYKKVKDFEISQISMIKSGKLKVK